MDLSISTTRHARVGFWLDGESHTSARSFGTQLTYAWRLYCHSRAKTEPLAGGQVFAGRASNPLDRHEKFQLVLTIIPFLFS